MTEDRRGVPVARDLAGAVAASAGDLALLWAAWAADSRFGFAAPPPGVLVAARVLFSLAWCLMPGVGITDARTILERVAWQRDAVWLSTVLQLVSAACFAPPLVALDRRRVRRDVRPHRLLVRRAPSPPCGRAVRPIERGRARAPSSDRSATLALRPRLCGSPTTGL